VERSLQEVPPEEALAGGHIRKLLQTVCDLEGDPGRQPEEHGAVGKQFRSSSTSYELTMGVWPFRHSVTFHRDTGALCFAKPLHRRGCIQPGELRDVAYRKEGAWYSELYMMRWHVRAYARGRSESILSTVLYSRPVQEFVTAAHEDIERRGEAAAARREE